MNIGLVQYDPHWEEINVSKDRILSLLEKSFIKESKIDWLIFPEMTLSGFSMNINKTTLKTEDIQFIKDICQQYSVSITFGGVMDGFNNNITLNTKGVIVSSYSKIHLFSYAKEESHYKSGDRVKSFDLNTVRITPLVCYDLRFPYLFWNAAKETDLYVVIANWPSSRISQWRGLLIARAIENQSFVVGVNRIGCSPSEDYNGNSLVVNPLGNIILECSRDEGVFTVSIEPAEVNNVRSKFQFMADRKMF